MLHFLQENLMERSILIGILSVCVAGGVFSQAASRPPLGKFNVGAYRDGFFIRAEKLFYDDTFFSADSFSTNEATLCNDFEEKNFSFFDEEAFFHIARNFLDTKEDFFEDSSGFC
jgi:hypothetical protein